MSDRGMAPKGRRVTSDEERRQRRAEVLALPMTPLRLHGYLEQPGHYPRSRVAVGVGPDDIAVAAWPAPEGIDGVVVTSHDGNGPYSAVPSGSRVRPAVSVVTVATKLAPRFVQPLGDRILVASARSNGTANAEVWTGSGSLQHAGFIGDGLEHLLTTARGAIWAGYFDEGVFGGTTPASSGLARFTSELEIDWTYPQREMPRVDDCYALNVSGEAATVCAYTPFHLITVSGDQARDSGRVPRSGAARLLTDGERAALIGGYGAEYDLITPLQITPGGVTPLGPQSRLVLPDGLEIPRGHADCRGADLHFFPDGSTGWYRVSLGDILPG